MWFIAAISGGVLSVIFEAPQSHRTLENSVVTALLAGIFLGEFWQITTAWIAGAGAAVVALRQRAIAKPARLRTTAQQATVPVRRRPSGAATVASTATSLDKPATPTRHGALATQV